MLLEDVALVGGREPEVEEDGAGLDVEDPLRGGIRMLGETQGSPLNVKESRRGVARGRNASGMPSPGERGKPLGGAKREGRQFSTP